MPQTTPLPGTGASLKLTILNHKGRVWTMVAGGGASVVYADTISDLGFSHELANYGEYSGAPSEEQTFKYAETILSLMTRNNDDRGKVLIVGGGIANFTDVAATFKGLILAIRSFADEIRANNIKIYVRRAGPNYQEGLRMMKQLAVELGLPIKVWGPETDAVACVPLALGLAEEESLPEYDPDSSAIKTVQKDTAEETALSATTSAEVAAAAAAGSVPGEVSGNLVQFDSSTRCIVYGLQQRAVQGMLDFDFMCKREKPSVAAMVFPFSGNHYVKFYWGTSETLIPVYTTIKEALQKSPDATVMVNFASFRSVYDTMADALQFADQLKTIGIIAEVGCLGSSKF